MTPQRIISVVPSQTELLFDLGLDAEVVGITKFCIHPAHKVRGKALVGGTKTLHLDLIHALRPDLILANKEENTREQIEEFQRHYPVHVTDVVTLPDALAMIREVGTLAGKEKQAEEIAAQIAQILPVRSGGEVPAGLRVAYFIWRKPYMVAAGDTFIHAILGAAGFQNAFAGQSRYPEVSADDLRAAQPDLIFLSSEPYPFARKHVAELGAICPSARVLVVDGEVFSWYGSRLLRAGGLFGELAYRNRPDSMIADISQLDPNGTYTYADYLKWDFEEWVELLEGEYRVFNKPGKSPLHQQIKGLLGRELTKQIHQPHYDIWHLPLPLIPGYLPAQESLTLVIPDIFVIDIGPPNLSDETGWHGIPLFVVEVADTRTATIDTTKKFDLYQRHGVCEYWIVQLQERNVHVYTLEDGKYALVDVYESGDIPSRIFPELTISHERIFQ